MQEVSTMDYSPEDTLLQALAGAGFTPEPEITTSIPPATLTVSVLDAFFEDHRIELDWNGYSFVITDLHISSSGVFRHRDFYGIGSFQGQRCRFYLIQQDERFPVGFLQFIS